MNKYATLFGGGMKDSSSVEYQETVLIGGLLANNGYIVKNGGYYGLMEAVSKGVFENGGTTIGYTCKTFPSIKGNDYLTENIPCEDVYDRLRCLIKNSEVFIIQRGGLGTLSEVATLLDETRKSKNIPKIYIIGDVWKNIFTSLNLIMNNQEKGMITFCENYEEFKSVFNI